jgi:hypothetical protein
MRNRPCVPARWRYGSTLAFALSALSMSSALTASPARKTLTAAEIRTTFVGKVVTDRYHWSYYLKPDGSVEAMETGRSRQGRWSIRTNLLCIHIAAGASPDQCWGVVREGNALIFQLDGNDIQDVAVEERRERRR